MEGRCGQGAGGCGLALRSPAAAVSLGIRAQGSRTEEALQGLVRVGIAVVAAQRDWWVTKEARIELVLGRGL